MRERERRKERKVRGAIISCNTCQLPPVVRVDEMDVGGGRRDILAPITMLDYYLPLSRLWDQIAVIVVTAMSLSLRDLA